MRQHLYYGPSFWLIPARINRYTVPIWQNDSPFRLMQLKENHKVKGRPAPSLSYLSIYSIALMPGHPFGIVGSIILKVCVRKLNYSVDFAIRELS